MALVACPFCREVFPKRERSACPDCGVALVLFERLPPPVERPSDPELADEPEWEPLALTYLGRGRGWLAALAVCGLGVFFSPWVSLTIPDVIAYSGFDIARRLGWAWAAGVAWFVLLPIVLSRRSIMQMRGARVAASFLSAIPGVTATILLLRPPHGGHGVPLRFTFSWGIYATLAVSLLALGKALFFGGRLDDIPSAVGTSRGQVVH